MAEKKPYLAMIFVQASYAGMVMLVKAALNQGMSTFVLVFYRQAVATVLVAPLAMVFARKSAPPMPFKLLIKIFALALFGLTLSLNMQSSAIKYSSASVASATMNLIPVFTFILALLLRLEIIKFRSISGIAKITGLVLCVSGVAFIVFYEGPRLKSLNHNHPIFHGSSTQVHPNPNHNKIWIIGSFLMVLVAISWASWIVFQGIILKEYPSKLWFTTWVSLFSTFQSFVAAIIFERNTSKWKLHWDEELIVVAYNGVIVACLVVYLQAWCIEKKGPVFVAMFTPLNLVITIACSSFLEGEVIKLGSVVVGALMIGGLYSVLWGKSKEAKENKPSLDVT